MVVGLTLIAKMDDMARRIDNLEASLQSEEGEGERERDRVDNGKR